MNIKHNIHLIANGFLGGFFLLLGNSSCAGSILESGVYTEVGGSGKLVIDRVANSKLTFSMEIIRINGHSCSLDGKIQDDHAVLFADDKDAEPCIVDFIPTFNGLDIKARDHRSCSRYCGARADLSETLNFVKPAKGCDASALASSRKSFKHLYDRHEYGKAEAILEPILANCKMTLDWFDTARIRNDLAITQYHLGHADECLKTLAPLISDADVLDEELNLSPSDADVYLPIIRATRTNLRLCKK
jgi:hypothetical protein